MCTAGKVHLKSLPNLVVYSMAVKSCQNNLLLPILTQLIARIVHNCQFFVVPSIPAVVLRGCINIMTFISLSFSCSTQWYNIPEQQYRDPGRYW